MNSLRPGKKKKKKSNIIGDTAVTSGGRLHTGAVTRPADSC